MKNILRFGFFILVINVVFIEKAQASYLGIAGATGTIMPGTLFDNCLISTGAIYSDGSYCYVYFNIPIESGKKLSTITVYYEDTSGSQSIGTYLYSTTLSTGANSTLASFSDTTTSASIQYSTLSYGSAISSSNTYNLMVSLNHGTKLIGMKVYYY